MSEKNKFERAMGIMLTVAKIASFLSLVMSVVIKTRLLLGLTNNLEQKKKDFLERKKKTSEKVVNEEAEGETDGD